MANVMFSLEGFSYGGEVQDKLSSTDNGIDNVEGGNIGKQFSSYEDWGESVAIDQLYSDYGFHQNVSSEQGFMFSKYQQPGQQEHSYSNHELLDNLRFDITSPPNQPFQTEIAKLDEIPTGTQCVVKPKKEKQFPFSLASLELLNNYGSGFKRLNSERRIRPSNDTNTTFTKVETRKLSTEEIMRIAGERFIRTSSRAVEDVVSMLSNPYDPYFSGLSDEEIRDVELAEFLLAAAEKVGDQQYERAIRLLNQCDCLSSKKGNPVQRVVYYFAEALYERIDLETGRVTSKQPRMKQPFDFEVAIMSSDPTTLACHEEIPFSKIVQFTGIQAIVENVAEAKKIHIIDLGIRNGIQWTVLMQALASRYECPIELLKITAVGTVFVNRFIEALFFFSAYFDCLDACMKPDNPHRMITEQVFFTDGIRSMVAAEGDKRKTRHVKLDVWRAFFVRYGMEETELSMSSLYQARLLVKQFACGSSCTIDMNGQSLIVGWKGTPMNSVSVWKFL